MSFLLFFFVFNGKNVAFLHTYSLIIQIKNAQWAEEIKKQKKEKFFKVLSEKPVWPDR